MNVRDAVAEFLLASGADGRSEKTIIWYRSLLGRFAAELGGQELTAITVNDLRAYLVRLREYYQSDDTVHGHSRALRKFWNWCTSEYDIKNPMTKIVLSKQPKPKMPKAVKAEDVIKLLAACDRSYLGIRNKALIAFLMDTGCRAAEVVGLTMDALDMEQGRAYVIGKGNETRVVFFTEFTASLLKEWLKLRNPESSTVFHGRWGGIMKPNALTILFSKLKKKAHIEGRTNPHSFRHGFARDFIKNGGSMGTLSTILGHKDQEVTRRFYAFFEVDEVAEQHRKYSPMRKIKDVIDREESDNI